MIVNISFNCEEFLSKKKQKVINKAKILLRDLKAEQEIVFCDEKLFTIEAYVNNHIKRLYTKYSIVIDESVRTTYR